MTMRELISLKVNGIDIYIANGRVAAQTTKDGLKKIIRFNTDNEDIKEPAWANKEVRVEYKARGERGRGIFTLTFTGRNFKLESVRDLVVGQ